MISHTNAMQSSIFPSLPYISHVQTCVPGLPLIMSKTSDSSNPLTALPSTVRSRSPFRNRAFLCAGPPGMRLLMKTCPVNLCCSSKRPILPLLSWGFEGSNLADTFLCEVSGKGDRLLTVDGNAVNGLALSEVVGQCANALANVPTLWTAVP